MGVIDWSKAPEGATHYYPSNDSNLALWVKYSDGIVVSVGYPDDDPGYWVFHYDANKQPKINMGKAIPRPSSPAWSGPQGGLPPAGTMVRVIDNGTLRYGANEQGPVIAHVEDCAVVRMSYGLGCFEASVLEPVRIPEQIAADQREVFISSISKLLEWDETMFGSRRDAGKLFDAGLRFPVSGQPK